MKVARRAFVNPWSIREWWIRAFVTSRTVALLVLQDEECSLEWFRTFVTSRYLVVDHRARTRDHYTRVSGTYEVDVAGSGRKSGLCKAF